MPEFTGENWSFRPEREGASNGADGRPTLACPDLTPVTRLASLHKHAE
jgi:hypothetical protein